MQLWSGWAWGALVGLVAFAATSLLLLAHDLGGGPWRAVPRPLRAELLAPAVKNLGFFLLAAGVTALIAYIAVIKLHAMPFVGSASASILIVVGIALPGRRSGMTESWSDPAFSAAANDAVNHQ